MKAHVIDQSLNEFIVMSYYIIAVVNHHQLTDLISFHNCNERLRLANQKPKTNSITSHVECLQCRNSKSSHQKLYAFECEYLSFHTVYGLETQGIYLYSPSLRLCKVLSKSEIWPKIWLEGLQYANIQIQFLQVFKMIDDDLYQKPLLHTICEIEFMCAADTLPFKTVCSI